MYVISAKIKEYNPIKHDEWEYEWGYFQYDNGAYGSGYPILSSFRGAKIFYEIEDAKKEFKKAKTDLLNDKDILLGTLAIRELKYKFVDVCKL